MDVGRGHKRTSPEVISPHAFLVHDAKSTPQYLRRDHLDLSFVNGQRLAGTSQNVPKNIQSLTKYQDPCCPQAGQSKSNMTPARA